MYQRHVYSMQTTPENTVLYFAYGANLSAATLGRRGVTIAPLRTQIARVSSDTTALVFAHRGGYATLAERDDSTTWPWRWLFLSANDGLVFMKPYGVLYEVTHQQLEAIKAKEIGYELKTIAIDVIISDGDGDTTESTSNTRTTKAVAFISSPWMVVRRPLPPSQRYRDLLLKGAKENNLPDEFSTWLHHLPAVSQAGLGAAEYEDTATATMVRVIGVLAVVFATVKTFFL